MCVKENKYSTDPYSIAKMDLSTKHNAYSNTSVCKSDLEPESTITFAIVKIMEVVTCVKYK